MPNDAPVVLIVDDDAAICTSLKRLLRAEGIAARTFPDTERLHEFGRPCGPCCLVLDVNLPNVGGLEFMDVLLGAGVRLPVIFITGVGTVPMSVRAMKAGAFDFLPKPFEAADLLRAVRRALAVDELLLAREQSLGDLRRHYRNLTDREREVFAAVTGGLLNKQVGSQLGVTEKTIKVHRGRVMEKMGAESLAALVRMACELDIHTDGGGGGGAPGNAADRQGRDTGPQNVDVSITLPRPEFSPGHFWMNG
jgi:FixJ family two-component response regulator